MVNVPGGNVHPLLTCLEDATSPPEDKTDAYLTLVGDLAKDDKAFVEEVCNFSARFLSVLTRDISSQKIDLSQAALQAVGYCIYQDQIVGSLREAEMCMIIQDLCNVVMKSSDKNLCTRALWSIAKQHLSTKVIIEKLPVILNTVEYALQTFESTTVENEAMEVIYRLVSELPSERLSSTAVHWSKLVYPLLISSAAKIREKALGILELGLKVILSAHKDVVIQLLPDLKGGLLSELARLFADNKEIFVLRAWTVLVTILGETLHKGGNLINDMLKITEQGFKSSLSDVQNMSYSAWICLTDNFAISPTFIGAPKKIKLLMMPLLLHSGRIVHKDIELARLQAWWHLVCAIKPEIYATSTTFSEVCLPLLQYYFNVNTDSASTPLGHSKDGLRELTLPVACAQANFPSPAFSTPGRNTPKRKSVIFNKAKFPEAFVKQVMLLGCEMLMELLATNTDEIRTNKRLTEHLQNPILNTTLFPEHLPYLLAVVKSALRCCGSYLEDELAVSIWSNIVNWIVTLLHNGDPKRVDDVTAALFLTANDILTCSCLSPNMVLKFLDVLSKIPVKYLLHPVTILATSCRQGKPVFLLADILFNQLSAFKGTYVDERFHIVFENLIDVALEAPSGKLTTVYNIWLALENLASTVANVEDLWRFWNKVTESVSECVTKTSDVNQGDSLEPDFSLMIALMSFPFKQLFTGGLPVATTKELDRDLAEFFRLFCRCASLVATAETNTCIEELSKSLLSEVNQEKCKNVKFLDSISGLIHVMMECVDFSAPNALPAATSHGSRTPGGKSCHNKNVLGNLSSLVALSAKVLSISYRLEKGSSGSVIVAPAVTVLAGSLSKLFASLVNPQYIKFAIAALSSSIASFISHHNWKSSAATLSDKKFLNMKYLLKIEKLWGDILMCLQGRYTDAYDSHLLEIMSNLLECTMCHHRRQFRNQTIVFWNATFGQASHLEYPASLRECLQTVLEKTPLKLPGWDQSKVPSYELPATLQDSEEMTPKENIIKQDIVMANSPKRKHGGSSPGKLKGSFLYKAFSSDKTERLSPFRSNLETGNKRKSPGSANARRKLPLPLDTAEDKDFVVIAPSPKKKRLLTEHQKEVKKAKKLESGHPALYNLLDQSQDGIQFSECSQSSMMQSFSHQDMEMSEEKNTPTIGDENGDDCLNKLKSSVETNFSILLENNVNSLDENALPNSNMDVGQDQPKVSEQPERSHHGVKAMSVIQKLLPGAFNPSNSTKENSIDDDDDDLIPSSQTTPSSSSRQNRRSFIHRQKCTPRNAKNKIRNSETDEIVNELVNENVFDSLFGTNNSEDTSKPIETDQNSTSMSTLTDTKKGAISKASAKNKWKKSPKTSPISSRTRCKKKSASTPDQSKSNKALEIVESAKEELAKIVESVPNEQPTNKRNSAETAITEMEEFSDHQLDDTQISSDSPVKDTSKSAGSEVKETEIANKVVSTNEAPSSPVASSCMKFVPSKNSATGSPLSRPIRSLTSPACSPTTGILKRSRGKADTPSPPGKTRHVSFAFPLQEEKEISLYPMDEVVTATQDNHKEIKHSSETTNKFTSIKATPTKSSTPPLSREECVFPDLVECTTPVEQILPSLATSRWSRGLGHVVHAQNIRTVGNLSALTKDQVEKLPIRSPKVSTLRRVLRNFHHNRAPKTPKVNQLRAIKEVEAEVEAGHDNGSPTLADNETSSKNTEQLTCTNTSPDLSGDKAPVIEDATTPSTSATSCDKMLTPKRSRVLVIPTTLFENDTDTETGTENVTEKLAVDGLCENKHVENIKGSEMNSTEENQKCVAESNMDVEEKENQRPCEMAVEDSSKERVLSVLSNNVDMEVIPEKMLTIEPSAKMDVEESGTKDQTQESEEMAVDELPTKELKQGNQFIAGDDIPATEELLEESPEMVHEEVPRLEENQRMAFDDAPVAEEPKPEDREMASEDVPTTEKLSTIEETGEVNQETSVKDASTTEAPKQENQELKDVDLPVSEKLKYENLQMPTEEIMVPSENTADPYVNAINDLMTLKSQRELAELPLNILLSCQEQLMAVLSNTTTAIRLKCEQSKI